LFRSLSVRLTLSTLVFLSLLLGAVAVTVFVLQRQTDDSLVVNLSGRQRMLTQRMTHQLLAFSAMRERSEDPQVQRQAVLLSMQVFETTLLALDRGGPAPMDLQMVNMRETPAASLAVAGQLSRVRNLWSDYRTEARAILDGTESQRLAGQRYVIEHNTELLSEMNSVVSLLQTEAEARVTRLYYIQGSAVAVALLLALFVIGIVRRSVVEPLQRLNVASDSISRGEVHVPVELRGPSEVRALGASVERLRVAMKNLIPPEPDGDFSEL
jgi:nitrate/nitrite-specific signal transduction histidine kinase